MGLFAQQVIFAHQVPLLINKAIELGFEVTLGEVLRTQEQQELYFKQGKSKTMNSYHLKKLAIDLNLFINGQFATLEQIKPLGDWWEKLDPVNQWGGNWKSFKDGPHFERHV